MAKYVNLDHLKFLMQEVHNVEEVLALERFSDYDMESIEMALDAMLDYSDRELYPYSAEMDIQGVKFENGEITCHPKIKDIFKYFGENGFIGSHWDYDQGGNQAPHALTMASGMITTAANNNAVGYPGLAAGAAGLIRSFGSKELFDTYTPKMLSGEWGGTMALTEPQAGSSLSDIVTSATPNGDGTYNITGQKIFISAGDHQCCENIIHLLLARIDGAPAGTKGISLFVVPKKRITDDGGLEPNDVQCAGEFIKMGQRGYVTTHLVFGEKEDCKAWLVGEENRGLKYMFQMMNGARLEVGLTAAAIASAAYHASLQYAKERPQGRKLNKSGDKDMNQEQTLIINHPDVRRMLLLQKSVVEGASSLLTLCGKYLDLSHYSESEEDRKRYHNLLELLTPIAKTYPSEMGAVSVSNGVQVLGGYGFTTDFPLEQYHRDIRITSLYEGTTGIQSLDLLGRKMLMGNGAAIMQLTEEINNDIAAAENYDDLKPYTAILKQKMGEIQKVMGHLMPFAMKGDYQRFLADATIYMELMSTVIIGWQWIKMSTSAKEALVTGNTRWGTEFYESQLHTMKFYFKYEMPKVDMCANIIMNQADLTLVEEGVNEIAF